ncbi:hypothetical protein, partial [Ralstonia pseudosolanacearum]
MDAHTPEPTRPDAPIPPGRGWGRRLLRWAGLLVAFVLLAVAALCGWLVWALQSPTGTAQLWSLATRFGHAHV